MPNEQPTGKSPEAKKEEEGGAEAKEQKGNLIMRMARGILRVTGRVGYPEEIPSANNENQEQKKEAAKEMGRLRFGATLGALTLVGFIALVFGGAIIGLKKLTEVDKWFMKGFNSVFSGGGKGGGGKKEKA